MKVIKLDQRKAERSSLRSKVTSVIMGIAMLTANVIRKMPKMKPTSLSAAEDMKQPAKINAAKYPIANIQYV